MKKITSIFLAIIIVGLTVILGIQEPIIVKAEEAQINAFVNDTVDLIRENDVDKDFVTYDESIETQSIKSDSVDNEYNDLTFQTCRLIVKSDKPIDKLNSVGISSGFQNYHIVQFLTPEDAEIAYNIYSADKNIISVTPDKVFDVTCDVAVTEEIANEESIVPERLDSWGGEVTGLYDVKDYIEANYTNLDEVVIGVVDSGIYFEHEFFKDRIVRTHFNSASDGEPNNERDTTGHGTNVSGVLVDCTPDNVKIANYKFISKNSNATTLAVSLAFLQAISDGVDVINASILVADESGLLVSVLQVAHKADIPIIAAAGNYSQNLKVLNANLPASDENVIAVASLSSNWLPSQFTSYGFCVDLFVPGENIRTATGSGNSYSLASGTSFSTPLVASLAAILISVYPQISRTELEAKMESTAVPSDLIAESDLFGYGCIDAIGACGFERAEAPIVDIDSGKYTGEICIDFTVDEGSEIYYTVDGTYPTKENGILYENPITFSNDMLYFKAVTYSDNSLRSECTKRFYRLQTVGTDEMFTISDNGCITSYTGKGINDLIIPSTVNNIRVTDIAENVFSDSDICGVTLPDSIDFVPNKAFEYNSTLLFADGEFVTTICENAFERCENLYSVEFPNAQNIEDRAFHLSRALSDAVFPYTISVGEQAFAGCRSMRRAYFPNVQTIGGEGFKGCRMLSEFYAPQLIELKLYSYRYGQQFATTELYEGLDLANVEIVPPQTFYYSSNISKVEFSKIKVIKSLPNALCLSGRSVKLILPSTFEECLESVLEDYEPHWYIVYGSKGTYAEQWANEHNFKFVEITPETAIMTDLPEYYYSYMRPLAADVVGFNRTYQWYGSNSADNTTGTPIDDATEKKFNPNEYKQYKYYYCVVTSTDIGYEPIEIRTGVTENKSYVASQEPEKEPADYTALDEVLSNIPKDLTVYTEESVANLKAIEESIDRNLDITKQEQVDIWAEAISAAVEKLVLKPANYSELKEALATVPSDLSIYTEESVSALQEVIDSIDYSLDITQQEKVNEYAEQITQAVENLEKECWFVRLFRAILAFFKSLFTKIYNLFY